jgi:arsenate reductase-like glutaredoxin family protein
MAKFPKIMERPIVFDDKKAVVGRPDENIINFVK